MTEIGSEEVRVLGLKCSFNSICYNRSTSINLKCQPVKNYIALISQKFFQVQTIVISLLREY